MVKSYLLIILIFFSSRIGISQYLSNPSFEGNTGIGICPPHWIPVGMESSPDTEPLYCDKSLLPSDGNSYITLVTRSFASKPPDTNEECLSLLAQPLSAEYCYYIRFDIASRPDVGFFTWEDGFTAYDNPTKLIIYGSAEPGKKDQVIFESQSIDNSKWQTQFIIVKPEAEINYIHLEAQGAFNQGNGNVSVDNFRIEKSNIPSTMILDTLISEADLPITLTATEGIQYSWSPATGLSCYDCRSPQAEPGYKMTYKCKITDMMGCPTEELFRLSFSDIDDPGVDFFIPNVFTPNNDGVNDYFIIPGLEPYSSLIVFDNDGIVVYMQENYANTWDGNSLDDYPLPEGTYWYVLTLPGFDKRYKSYVYLKRN